MTSNAPRPIPFDSQDMPSGEIKANVADTARQEKETAEKGFKIDPLGPWGHLASTIAQSGEDSLAAQIKAEAQMIAQARLRRLPSVATQSIARFRLLPRKGAEVLAAIKAGDVEFLVNSIIETTDAPALRALIDAGWNARSKPLIGGASPLVRAMRGGNRAALITVLLPVSDIAARDTGAGSALSLACQNAETMLPWINRLIPSMEQWKNRERDEYQDAKIRLSLLDTYGVDIGATEEESLNVFCATAFLRLMRPESPQALAAMKVMAPKMDMFVELRERYLLETVFFNCAANLSAAARIVAAEMQAQNPAKARALVEKKMSDLASAYESKGPQQNLLLAAARATGLDAIADLRISGAEAIERLARAARAAGAALPRTFAVAEELELKRVVDAESEKNRAEIPTSKPCAKLHGASPPIESRQKRL